MAQSVSATSGEAPGKTVDMAETGNGCEIASSEKSRSAESATALPLERWITSSHFAGSMTLCGSTEETFKGCANRVIAERQLEKMAASAEGDER